MERQGRDRRSDADLIRWIEEVHKRRKAGRPKNEDRKLAPDGAIDRKSAADTAAVVGTSRAKGGAGRKGGVSEYARQIGRPRKTVEEWVSAAEVVKNMADIRHVFDKTYHLSAIHSAPEPVTRGT